MSFTPNDPFPDLSVQSVAACEVGPGVRLIGAPIAADTIYLVLAGRLHLKLPTGESSVGAGSLVLLRSGQQPGIASSSNITREVVATRERLAQRGGLLVFDAAGGTPGELRVLVGRVRGDLSGRLPTRADDQPLHVDLRGIALARGAYAALRAELDDPSPGFGTLATTLMKACLLLFVRVLHSEENVELPPASAAGQRIAAVAASVRARPADPYSLDALAKSAGMSRATFARQFAQHIGMTPMEFVLRERLQDAAGILRTSGAQIKQVAADTGFQSRTHFARAFQAHFGIGPSEFRAAAASPLHWMTQAPLPKPAPTALPGPSRITPDTRPSAAARMIPRVDMSCAIISCGSTCANC